MVIAIIKRVNPESFNIDLDLKNVLKSKPGFLTPDNMHISYTL